MNKIFFIAEVGLNHNGDLDLAKKMVDAAKVAGADAVKFQSIAAKKLISQNIFFQKIDGFGFEDVKTIGDFLGKVSIDESFHNEINKHCDGVCIEFMSTPFDFDSVDLLDVLGVERFKIASGDITHFPLLAHIAKKGKPIILSTGASTIGEIEKAIEFIKKNGTEDITLLHCISLYPTPAKLANLNAIPFLKSIFDLPVGFSDHTMGYHIPIAAIAKGAVVIEKHFTLDKNMPGPDQKLSADPEEFRKMVDFGRDVYQAIIEERKVISEEEQKMRIPIRRSIVAARNISKGETLKLTDLEFKRPGDGLSAKYFLQVIGKSVNKNIKKDKQIMFGDLYDYMGYNNKHFDLIYYCDSYPAIGMGHLARAINILNSLYGRDESYKIAITGKFSQSAIQYRDSFLNDGIEVIDVNKNINAKIYIIDTMFDPINESYIDENFCNKIKSLSQKLILMGGFLGEIKIPESVDIFINYLSDVEIIGNIKCTKYIGFDYAPVASDFVREENIDNDKNLLVVIGGNDNQFGPASLLESLEKIKLTDYEINMIVSPHYPQNHIRELEKIVKSNKVKIFKNVESLIPFFRNASVIICTYGNITYEVLTFHLPTFICSYKKFQNDCAKYLEEKGLVLNLGYFSAINMEQLRKIKSDAVKISLVENARKRFKKSGIENIINILEKEFYSKTNIAKMKC